MKKWNKRGIKDIADVPTSLGMRCAILILLLSASVQSQSIVKLEWSDLIPKNKSFDDPFAKLTSSQLDNLSVLARIRSLQQENSKVVTERLIQKHDRLVAQLTNEGVNVDSLLQVRSTVMELRRKQSEATDERLDGSTVQIRGYLLPLDFIDGTSTEFLLVPWVGACIHTPPPPTNQIVYVKYEIGYDALSRSEAVAVQGTISVEKMTTELYLEDGFDNIHSGYAMRALSIETIE